MFKPPVLTLNEKEVRMFYHNLYFSDDGLYCMMQVHDMNISIDEKVLEEVLGVHTQGTKSLKDNYCSKNFIKTI